MREQTVWKFSKIFRSKDRKWRSTPSPNQFFPAQMNEHDCRSQLRFNLYHGYRCLLHMENAASRKTCHLNAFDSGSCDKRLHLTLERFDQLGLPICGRIRTNTSSSNRTDILRSLRESVRFRPASTTAPSSAAGLGTERLHFFTVNVKHQIVTMRPDQRHAAPHFLIFHL